jgi:shikimate kinase
MGSGKSTVGSRVAARLGYGFIDLDRLVEQRAGMTIGELFASKGEEAFRTMESEELAALPREGSLIVATGGGTPCFGDNMSLMKERGKVVWLKADPRTLTRRLKRGQSRRPKIAGMDERELLDYVAETLALREAFYSRADVTIDCNGVGDEYISAHLEYIIEAWQITDP